MWSWSSLSTAARFRWCIRAPSSRCPTRQPAPCAVPVLVDVRRSARAVGRLTAREGALLVEATGRRTGKGAGPRTARDRARPTGRVSGLPTGKEDARRWAATDLPTGATGRLTARAAIDL